MPETLRISTIKERGVYYPIMMNRVWNNRSFNIGRLGPIRYPLITSINSHYYAKFKKIN